MIDLAILEQIYNLPLSASIRENVNAFPIIESLHVISIAILFGTILIVDLRLIGIASYRIGTKSLMDDFLPYTWSAFALAVVTGLLMFISNAVSYANNLQFQLKLIAIVIAGLNMMWFHSKAYRRISIWDEDANPPISARYAGWASLLVWTVTIFLGRWIGFTLEVFF